MAKGQQMLVQCACLNREARCTVTFPGARHYRRVTTAMTLQNVAGPGTGERKDLTGMKNQTIRPSWTAADSNVSAESSKMRYPILPIPCRCCTHERKKRGGSKRWTTVKLYAYLRVHTAGRNSASPMDALVDRAPSITCVSRVVKYGYVVSPGS